MVAVISGIKLGRLLGDVAANLSQVCPVALIRGGFDGASHEVYELGILFELVGRHSLERFAGRFFFAAEHLGVNKFIAGRHKRFGRFLFTKSIYNQPRLPDTGCQFGKVAVAGYQAKPIEPLGIEQIHGINNHGTVGGIFAGGVAKLLYRLDRVIQQMVFPAAQFGGSPVAIDALYIGGSVFGNFCQKSLNNHWLGIIGINEDGQLVGRFGIHGLSKL